MTTLMPFSDFYIPFKNVSIIMPLIRYFLNILFHATKKLQILIKLESKDDFTNISFQAATVGHIYNPNILYQHLYHLI